MAISEAQEAVYSENPVEMELAKYMVEVFKVPIDRSNAASISTFLHSKMIGTPYISSRGEHRYFHKLWEDMKKYYLGVPEMELIKEGHIQRILGGQRVVYSEVCMVAMFLGVSVEELTNMQIPLKKPEEQFDEEVKRLRNSGMSMKNVASEIDGYTVTKLADGCFRELIAKADYSTHSSITNYEIPETVEEIGAQIYSPMHTVILGENVKYIEATAFNSWEGDFFLMMVVVLIIRTEHFQK